MNFNILSFSNCLCENQNRNDAWQDHDEAQRHNNNIIGELDRTENYTSCKEDTASTSTAKFADMLLLIYKNDNRIDPTENGNNNTK